MMLLDTLLIILSLTILILLFTTHKEMVKLNLLINKVFGTLLSKLVNENWND